MPRLQWCGVGPVMYVCIFLSTVFLCANCGLASDLKSAKVYSAIVAEYRGDLQIGEPQDLVASLATFVAAGKSVPFGDRIRSAFELAEGLAASSVPTESMLKIAGSGKERNEICVAAVLVASKSLLEKRSHADCERRLFDFARNQENVEQARSVAYQMLLMLSSSPNAAIRDCTRELASGVVSDLYAESIGKHLFVVSTGIEGISADLAVNCILQSYSAKLGKSRKVVLLDVLWQFCWHDKSANCLQSQTRMDIHVICQKVFCDRNEDEAVRIEAARLINRDLSVGDEVIAAAKAIVSEPSSSAELKSCASKVVRRSKGE